MESQHEKTLIFGSSGFLGTYFLELRNTFGASRTPKGDHSSREFMCDLFDFESVNRIIEQVNPRTVINCVALTSIEKCEANPEFAYRVNSELPGFLGEITAHRNLNFVHFSTDAVFDGTKSPYSEDATTSPISIYGKTKLEGEINAINVNPRTLVLRTNFYGFSFDRPSLFNYFYLNLIQDKACLGYTNVLFSPIYVKSLCDSTLTLINQFPDGGIFHLVGKEALSKFEFGRKIAMSLGKDISLVQPTDRPENSTNVLRSYDLRLSSDKLPPTFGTTYSLEEGIVDSLRVATGGKLRV